MSTAPATAPLVDSLGLLERAVGFTRGALALVTPVHLSRPTPCREWDLGRLLNHMSDSLCALQDAADLGYVDLDVPTETLHDPVVSLRLRACSLLGAWTRNGGAGLVSVAGSLLSARVLVATGALEVAVHGWDVARACGGDLALPSPLGAALLTVVPLVVDDIDRPRRFADPVDLPPSATPGERLLALLGRDPWA